MPPPSTVGCSCVYIVRRGDGRFYCGQTDELRGRLNRHRKTGKVRGGGRLEAVYLVVPSEGQGQSTARAVEAQVIQVSHGISSTDLCLELTRHTVLMSHTQVVHIGSDHCSAAIERKLSK